MLNLLRQGERSWHEELERKAQVYPEMAPLLSSGWNRKSARCEVRSAKVEKFEDLVAWQKAHALAIKIYQLTSKEKISRDFGLKDQIQRAAVSVMSNIAEGFERYSRPEFRQFLSIARGSVAEVRSQLHIAKSLSYISGEFTSTYALCRDVGNLIGGLRKSLEKGDAS